MINIIGWGRYSLWIKHLKDLNAVKKYIKENQGHCIVAVSGKIKYKSIGVKVKWQLQKQ